MKALPIDEDFVKEKDEIEQCFEKICKNNGIEYPKELVDNFSKKFCRNYFRFKMNTIDQDQHTIFDIKLTKQMILPSMKTPSFPSDHSTQGILISKVLYLIKSL